MTERSDGPPVQRIAFTMRIRPGTQAEYRRRHLAVWPDLLEDLSRAGCHNYSIYLRGTELFAYMEVDDFPRYVAAMAESDANRRWQEQMGDILIVDTDPATSFAPTLEEVFHLD